MCVGSVDLNHSDDVKSQLGGMTTGLLAAEGSVVYKQLS